MLNRIKIVDCPYLLVPIFYFLLAVITLGAAGCSGLTAESYKDPQKNIENSHGNGGSPYPGIYISPDPWSSPQFKETGWYDLYPSSDSHRN
jgi:hypothetical protein